jgi:mRNA interferase MazF
MYKQGTVVLVPFPFDDLTGVKQRPALILSNSTTGAHHICCMITSKPPPEGILLSPNAFTGGSLPKRSWVRPHKLFTVNAAVVKKKLCSVNRKLHSAVIGRIDKHTSWEG